MGTTLSKQTVIQDIVTGDPDYLPVTRANKADFNYNCVTDAIATIKNLLTMEKTIEIERNLKFYEKVSLVFLLYDDTEVALQYLLQLQNGAILNVVEEWAKFSKMKDWQNELLEALCIIQNYRLITKLGANVRQQIDHFLPLVKDVAVHVNLNRKKLYRIFEELDRNEIEQFISLVRNDFNEKKIQFLAFNSRYIEMYLLHWISVRYITPFDFSNLSKIFKIMEKFEISDYLKSNNNSEMNANNTIPINRRVNLNVSSSALINSSTNTVDLLPPHNEEQPSLSVSSISSQIEIHSDHVSPIEIEKYNIDSKSPGVCLIINQEYFFSEPEKDLQHLLPNINGTLDQREGTNVDKDCLKQTFESFGYRVIVEKNLMHWDILSTIEQTVESIRDESSLVVCILSHGIEGKVYGSNSIPVEVSKIRNIVCSKNVKHLRRKPKILILQACQGEECQRVVEDDEQIEMDGPTSSTAVPLTADVLVFWATVPGFGAVRDKLRGTWFIQSLCKTINERAHKNHFEEICTLVKNDVIHKRWQTKNDTRGMVPVLESTLSKFFYLPKKNCQS